MVGRAVCRLIPCLAVVALWFGAACQPGGGVSGAITCYPSGQCFDGSGTQVCEDANSTWNPCGSGVTQATSGTTTSTTGTSSGTGTGGGLTNPNSNQPILVKSCDCRSAATQVSGDSDGDCILDATETKYGNSDPALYDTDGDGVSDGCEDVTHDGVYTYGVDTDPRNPDSDCDGLWDGVYTTTGQTSVPQRSAVLTALAARDPNATPVCRDYALNPSHYTFADGTKGGEDRNGNGYADTGETDPRLLDSDRDNIPDGLEDANLDGKVTAWIDVNGDGCFTPGTDTPGESDPSKLDTDGDAISDGVEDKNFNGTYDPNQNGLQTETIAWLADTDCDKIPDGVEDKNRNGILDAAETSPRLQDSDGDGLCDGKEDANHNGTVDSGKETSPLLVDSDGDGIPDGIENHDPNNVSCAGPQGTFGPTNPNNCWDGNPLTAGASDPRKADTDGDGIKDGLEDVNHDGLCQTANVPNPVNPSQTITTFIETCAFTKDTDCDGLTDNLEDKNANGVVDIGETDPRLKDTDYDGLQDGCKPANSNTPPGCEDKNANGLLDPNETDPTSPDSDGDLLSDSCELSFAADSNPVESGPTNPLKIDSDGDGVADGDEDANHNCQVDAGETDPRHYDAPPSQGSSSYPQYEVCAADSLNNVTFAEDSRSYADVRVAFEEERAASGATCPKLTDVECPSGQNCLGGQCVTEAPYIVQAYGIDNDGTGFDENDQNDTLWGWMFESPPGVAVDSVTGTTINRDIYGFVQLSEDGRALDDILDGVRDAFSTGTAGASVTQTGSLPQRAAFDSTTKVPVNFAQRQFSFSFQSLQSNLSFRNAVLNQFVSKQAFSPAAPVVDPVYGTLNCGASSRDCYTNFTLYMTAVQRPQQLGPNGQPVVILLVALTQNDTSMSDPSSSTNRLYPDRLARLQDLTGGSAVAHFNASTGKACDQRPQTPSRADVLWVVDDSRSMQQIISRLENAANSAKTILTSNSGIIDYRIGMTTTNPSPTGGTQCPSYCDNKCNGTSATIQPTGYATSNSGQNWCTEECADQSLGCIKSCSPGCVENAVNPNGYTTCSSCGSDINNNMCGSCTGTAPCTGSQACVDTANPNNLIAAIAADGATFSRALPGGGGTFYYEDTSFMDCDSFGTPPQYDSSHRLINSYDGQTLQYQFVNNCMSQSAGFSSTLGTGNIPSFFGSSGGRVMLTGNQGMIGADPNVLLGGVSSCNLTMLDLNSITVSANDCTVSGTCCGRLTAACDDGATVFGSQMCDLIRAMGGLPQQWAPGVSTLTSGARRHSAPEQGSRSARRLVASMIPALPLDYSKARDNAPGDANTYNPKTHLRLNCKGADDSTCRACNPQTDSSCTPIPLATIILSDEEDFYFKDDCQAVAGNDPNALNGGGADMTELPLNCLYVDGDPTTADSCSASYCSSFTAGNPNGYNPDQAAWTTDGFYTLKWRNSNAAECSASNLSTTCLADPCPTYAQSACLGAGSAPTYCVWTGSQCLSQCANVTNYAAFGSVAATAQRNTCEGLSMCQWDQSQASSNVNVAFKNACKLKYPINDCQACKRYNRLQSAVSGNVNPGLGKVGPVYAITRNKGEPGFGSWLVADGQDSCQGGSVTWGRGDGQAYRDIATATLGRVQDVCASDYSSFMQLLVSDLAILSKPYPLSANPIAATLKVGISRPDASNPGSFSYVAVPRSQTSGFFYDATGNTIGFKSDPVDGQCGALSCLANGVIETNEIIYAETAPFVPQPGDQIYISYRTWNPVPCGGGCAVGQTCAEVVCTQQAQTSCPVSAPGDANANAFCSPGYYCCGTGDTSSVCNSQSAGTCVQNCNVGTLVEACVNQPECAACESYNATTHKCEAIPDTCTCNSSSGQSCNPQSSVNSCPIGYSCDESCVCTPSSTCSVSFNNNGSINCGSSSGSACGTAAVNCCNNYATKSAAQTTHCGSITTKTPCTQDSNCIWRGTDTSGQCGAEVQPCCPAGSTPGYYVDPELGTVSIICSPAACECCCAAGLECDPTAPPPPGPSNSCTDGSPMCACYSNGG